MFLKKQLKDAYALQNYEKEIQVGAALTEDHPLEYESLKTFWQDGLYSPCNMLVARKEVLDDLCEWLFPILFAVAEHGGQKEDIYLNRYPGFLSERLISCFFEMNKDKYKVVYADKNFLQ